MMKVAALTSGKNVPSARFRVRQYVNYLKSENIFVEELYSSIDKYSPPSELMHRLAFRDWKRAVKYSLWLKQFKKRPLVGKANKYDLIWLERNLVETRLTYEHKLKRPLVLDVDDAIWLKEAKGFADKLVSFADIVFAGNLFLADWISNYNPNVKLIPTAVDTAAYFPVETKSKDKMIVGWIGTSSNFDNLKMISNAFELLSKENSDFELHICSDRKPQFFNFPFHFIQWKPEIEIPFIQNMDIGLMPLEDNDWNRGKCSLKMLQYMSCGVPALVSPVGMNYEVLNSWDNEMGAKNDVEWYDKVKALLRNPDKLRMKGEQARKVICETYSMNNIGKKIADHFREIV